MKKLILLVLISISIISCKEKTMNTYKVEVLYENDLKDTIDFIAYNEESIALTSSDNIGYIVNMSTGYRLVNYVKSFKILK